MSANISIGGNTGGLSYANSVITTVIAGATWEGEWEDVSRYPSLTAAPYSDGTGVLRVQFADENLVLRSTLPFVYDPNILEPPHRFSVTRPYARVTFENTSGSTINISISTLLGNQTQLNSGIDSLIAPDADASIIRPMNFELLIAENKFQNRRTIFKDGSTPVMTTGNVTQDLWAVSGAYTGFPLIADELQLVVEGNDVGIYYVSYLESADSLDYSFAGFPINGANTYNLGVTGYRSNFSYFVRTNDATLTGFNVGVMTLRQRNNITNIFHTIPIGQGQSNCAAFTTPNNAKAYIYAFNGNARDGAAASSKGWLWYRNHGESPRLRNQFTLVTGGQYQFDPKYLFLLPAKVDIMPRITNNSTNNMSADVNYIIHLVKNH